MFTIKHIADSGNQEMHLATEVGYTPSIQANAEGAPAPAFVWYSVPNHSDTAAIDNGIVYVMNETGATVAKYDLASASSKTVLSVDRVKEMAERFLRWKLPANFNPDGGISFAPTYNNGTPQEGRHEPTGTNLFGYTEAVEMVRYMLGTDSAT